MTRENACRVTFANVRVVKASMATGIGGKPSAALKKRKKEREELFSEYISKDEKKKNKNEPTSMSDNLLQMELDQKQH